ncbi:hypothetical protein IKD82_01955 [Candidatus Saccharibacteria bacterium]|nr:hypothetical protein [Candidatus Saccharibacteria bacterium]
MININGIRTRARQLKYKIQHDYLTVENVFLLAAIILCLALTYQSITAMSRNWELSERLRAERKQLELLTIEVEASELENEYYRSEEYQELLAKRNLDKKLPGENMVVMPENSEAARNKYKTVPTEEKEKQYSNFEKWMMYLFPSY